MPSAIPTARRAPSATSATAPSASAATGRPDATARANAYVTATPGGSLNLSSAEIAAFAQLGAGASVVSVEQQVRSALLARVQAYQSQGLAGIAPYARANGQRSGADELGRWMTETRNVYDDFKRIYGEAPTGPVGAVSVAIDSNDTRSSAESYIGTILFRKP